MAMALSASALDSQGANNRFYVSPDPIAIDATTHLGAVNVYLDNETDNFNTFLIDFYLPEGFTIEKNKKGVYKVFIDEEGKAYTHQMTVTDRGTFYRFIGCSMSSTWIETGDGLLFSFNVVAPEDFEGTAEVTMSNIQVAAGNTVETVKKHTMDDLTFAVVNDSQTVIEEVIAGEAPAAEGIYDLHGRRVARPTSSGLYIVNGTKTVIR